MSPGSFPKNDSGFEKRRINPPNDKRQPNEIKMNAKLLLSIVNMIPKILKNF